MVCVGRIGVERGKKDEWMGSYLYLYIYWYPETLDKACFFVPGQKSMGGYFLALG